METREGVAEAGTGVPWFKEWAQRHRRVCGGSPVAWAAIAAEQLNAWSAAFARHRITQADANEASDHIAVDDPHPAQAAKLVIEYVARKHGTRGPEGSVTTPGIPPRRLPGGPSIPWERIEDPNATWERSRGCPECTGEGGAPGGIARRPCAIAYKGPDGEPRAMRSSGGLLCRCAIGRALRKLRDEGDPSLAFPDLQARPDLWGAKRFPGWETSAAPAEAIDHPEDVRYYPAGVPMVARADSARERAITREE